MEYLSTLWFIFFIYFSQVSLATNQHVKKGKFTCFPLGKALEKQTKTIEDQGKKQIKTIEVHGKQLIECNELIKKDFNIDKHSIPREEQKNIS